MENFHGKLLSLPSRYVPLILAQLQWSAVDDGPGLHAFGTSLTEPEGRSHSSDRIGFASFRRISQGVYREAVKIGRGAEYEPRRKYYWFGFS
jgi:hypothetical protein